MLKLCKMSFLAATLACTGLVSAAEITWKVPTSVPEGSPFYNNFLVRFADNVDTLTSGRIKIEPFGAGVLVPALKVYEGVMDDVVKAGLSTPSYLVNQDPINAIYAGFPGGMGGDASMTWFFEGGGKAALQKTRDEQGLKTMIVGIGSSEILAHSNKPIRTTADLKGMKYRTSGAWAEVMKESFGAVPTVVPAGDIYTLLQRKGVDAVEWSSPGANMPEGFHQAAKYVIIPGVHQPTFMWEVVMKKDTWESVPDDLKPKLEAAAELTARQSLTHFYDTDMKAMEELRAGRNEVISLEPDVVKELAAAGYKWMEATAEKEKEAGRPEMAEVLKQYREYQDRWLAQVDYNLQ